MNIAELNYHATVGFEIGFAAGNINNELTEGFNEYEPYLILAKDFPELNSSQFFTRLSVGFANRKLRHEDPDEDEKETNELSQDVGFLYLSAP